MLKILLTFLLILFSVSAAHSAQDVATAPLKTVELEFKNIIAEIFQLQEDHQVLKQERALEIYQTIKQWEDAGYEYISTIVSFLKSEDPNYRGLACLVLSLQKHRRIPYEYPSGLYSESFLPDIANLLDDSALSLPYFTFMTSVPLGFSQTSDGEWFLESTVRGFAQRSIYEMTGRKFYNKEIFRKWWNGNEHYDYLVWYWQRLFYRAQLIEGRKGVEEVFKKLQKYDKEVVAKIMILAMNPNGHGGPALQDESNEFFSKKQIVDYLKANISKDRLLDIFELKNIESWRLYNNSSSHWRELVVEDPFFTGRASRARFMEMISSMAVDLFTKEDVPRLKAIAKKGMEGTEESRWWYESASLITAISRLDPENRVKTLKEKIEHSTDEFVVRDLAKELIETSLDEEGNYIIDLYYKQKHTGAYPGVRLTTLRMFCQTPARYGWAVKLINDPRFESISFQDLAEAKNVLQEDLKIKAQINSSVQADECMRTKRADWDADSPEECKDLLIPFAQEIRSAFNDWHQKQKINP